MAFSDSWENPVYYTLCAYRVFPFEAPYEMQVRLFLIKKTTILLAIQGRNDDAWEKPALYVFNDSAM